MCQKFKNKIPHHHHQQLSIILMWGIGSLVFKYTCFVSVDSAQNIVYQLLKPYPPVIQLSVQTSVPDVNWPGVLGYMLVSKTNFFVVYFCKVALKQQKHLKGNFFLSEYNYPKRSDLSCKFPGWPTADNFWNDRPHQSHRRELKTLLSCAFCTLTERWYNAVIKRIGLLCKQNEKIRLKCWKLVVPGYHTDWQKKRYRLSLPMVLTET